MFLHEIKLKTCFQNIWEHRKDERITWGIKKYLVNDVYKRFKLTKMAHCSREAGMITNVGTSVTHMLHWQKNSYFVRFASYAQVIWSVIQICRCSRKTKRCFPLSWQFTTNINVDTVKIYLKVYCIDALLRWLTKVNFITSLRTCSKQLTELWRFCTCKGTEITAIR